jgi:hypothetical protein
MTADWVASYTGKGGIRMSFGPAEWLVAANGLRVLIEAARPDGVFDLLCVMLRVAKRGCVFDCTRGTETIGLRQVGSAIVQRGQPDLFGRTA